MPAGVPVAYAANAWSYSARSSRWPTSITASDFGSRPRSTSVRRTPARATSPDTGANASSDSNSAWTIAATTTAGTDVEVRTSASVSSRDAASDRGAAERGPIGDEIGRGDRVQPGQRLSRRARPGVGEQPDLGLSPQGALDDGVVDRRARANVVERDLGARQPGRRPRAAHRRLGRDVGRTAAQLTIAEHRVDGRARVGDRIGHPVEVEQRGQRISHGHGRYRG